MSAGTSLASVCRASWCMRGCTLMPGSDGTASGAASPSRSSSDCSGAQSTTSSSGSLPSAGVQRTTRQPGSAPPPPLGPDGGACHRRTTEPVCQAAALSPSLTPSPMRARAQGGGLGQRRVINRPGGAGRWLLIGHCARRRTSLPSGRGSRRRWPVYSDCTSVSSG
jgi:hypothetical protein